MNKFIRELRRREVFRSAGLYVGVAWILIEVSSVLFDAFGAPDWALQAVIILAVIGFPVTLVLAWIYDVSETGIHVQADPTDTIVVPFGGRRMDFAVIGVLIVALAFSVYLNVISGPKVVEELEPLSVLIADFDNRTGDEVFDGSLESALQIGIESAPFVTTFNRRTARGLASQLRAGDEILDADVARLVSVREGINVVVAGVILSKDNGKGYELEVRVLDGASGEQLADSEIDAKTKADVLAAVGAISGDVREALGDTTVRDMESGAVETFTAASIEAVQAYTRAQLLALSGDYEGSLEYYASAVDKDPNFGRALSGWALSLFTLGRTEEAGELWASALSKMDTMTERERLRTLGLYYMAVTGNYDKAIETYEELVSGYPADNAGRNNLAIAYFATLNFDEALEQGREALAIYPNNEIMRSNLALYAMYAGDFDTSRIEAEALLELNDSYFTAFLPIAMAANAEGKLEQSRAAFAKMAIGGDRGISLGNLGLADAAMYQGAHELAVEILNTGIQVDEATGNVRSAAIKLTMLADAQQELGQTELARENIDLALESNGLAVRVPSALLSLDIGNPSLAAEIASELGTTLQPQSRAYGLLIDGAAALHDSDAITAVDAFSSALELADLWLIRYYRGLAYFEGGFMAEALDEFRLCDERRGAATAVYLDDLPTWRYMSELPYWIGRAELELGMTDSGLKQLERFVNYRQDGPLVADARSRLP